MGKKKKAEALKAREAAIAAELAKREAEKATKAKKKAKAEPAPKPEKKKGKKAKREAELVEKAAAPELDETERAMVEAAKAERQAAREAESAKTKTAKAAAKVLADTNAAPEAKAMAENAKAAADEATHDETDADIKARVAAKRAARLAGNPSTSSVEALDAIAEGRAPKPETVEKVEAAVEAIRHEVEELETERGREFVAGTPSDEPAATTDRGFALPSDAPAVDFETNGNGQYKVKRPSDGKVVGYTRATTYIANLEDRTMLEKWKLRMLLEGVAVNDAPAEGGRDIDPVVGVVRDLIHTRDVAILKARKADRKGKLQPGQLAILVDGAWSTFKKALDELAETLLDLGGANEASTKGTDLHALTEVYDREGIDAIGDMLAEGKISPADFADITAYAEAMERAGIKLDLIEQTVVNDELKVGGRLDRTGLVKFPGMARATRCVIDIKTGRIDLGAGKLAQQLAMYAGSVAYDLDTDERTDMRLSRTKAVVVHLPQGTGQCSIYPVDLVLGLKGNRLSGEVRAWRNEGKRAVDFKTDLAAVASTEAAD